MFKSLLDSVKKLQSKKEEKNLNFKNISCPTVFYLSSIKFIVILTCFTLKNILELNFYINSTFV